MRKVISLLLFISILATSLKAQPNAPQLENGDSWTMIVLPDPQSYIKFEQNQPIFSLITRWIKLNKEKLNIELVLCEGDLVEQNNIPNGDGTNGNQNSTQQWTAVREAFSILDTVLPYILCTGNHDYGFKSAENRQSQFGEYFKAQDMVATNQLLAGTMPNAFGEKTLENAYYEFLSPHGVTFLIMSLEFAPRDTIVKQASAIISRKKYINHKGIILTHSYMKSTVDKNILIKHDPYKLKDATRGKELWEKLIAPSSNIEMVFCGHFAGVKNIKQGVGYRKELNAGQKNVHQMLFNAQTEGGGWNGNGGDGWIRILEFLPDKKTVIIKTFSPYFAYSPSTIDKAWRKKSYDNFNLELAD